MSVKHQVFPIWYIERWLRFVMRAKASRNNFFLLFLMLRSQDILTLCVHESISALCNNFIVDWRLPCLPSTNNSMKRYRASHDHISIWINDGPVASFPTCFSESSWKRNQNLFLLNKFEKWKRNLQHVQRCSFWGIEFYVNV